MDEQQHDDETGAVPPPPPPAPPQGQAPAAWQPAGRLDDPSTRRNWAAAGHWTALVAAFAGGFAFLGPLAVWLIKRDTDTWVASHAVEALNFQLTWFAGAVLGGFVGVVLSVLSFGMLVLPFVVVALLAGLAWLVLSIMGAVKASRAEDFRYPLTVRLITV